MKPIALTFLNGVFSAEKSEAELLPESIEFRTGDGIFLRVKPGFELTRPIKLIFAGSDNYALHNTIILEDNSRLVLIEEHVGKGYQVTLNSDISLLKNASLEHYHLQKGNADSAYAATLFVEQDAASHFSLFTADRGMRQFQQALAIKLKEAHAACQLQGLYLLSGEKDSHTQHIHVEHMAPHSQSAMFYKGILDHNTAAHFQGKVHIHKKALQTTALQANHNLLLSKKASVTTQPELEIYADDVKCSHGATVSELDADALFYLQSRGVNDDEARAMLKQAFMMEVLNKISNPFIKAFISGELSPHEFAC